MLLSLFFLLFLARINADANSPNYFVDAYEKLESVYYAYPLDICLRTGTVTFDNTIYTCINDNTAVKKTVCVCFFIWIYHINNLWQKKMQYKMQYKNV